MTRKTPDETRERLQWATAELIVEHGAARLTLDAVAHAAGVSKGGLLHHFPTKDALLRGLLDLLDNEWHARLARELTQEGPEIMDTPGRRSRAYIRATFEREERENHLMLALTRAVAAYPELSEAYRAAFTIESPLAGGDGLSPGRALAIRVACDGIWLGEFAGLPLITDQERAELRAELLRLTR